jgi:hypothetical protein
MTPQDQIVACHECGHAVSYIHFGWRFGRIRLYEKDGEILGAVSSPAGTYDPMARAICCLAGPLSEERLTGVPWGEQPGSRIDIQMAREALARLGDDDLTINSIVPFTRLMIEHEFQAIELLASHLLAYNELSYEQVVELVQRAV